MSESAKPVAELPAEDSKLVTLARATKARTQAVEAAAVRDLDGRTYAAATTSLESLQLSALAGCVAMALSSGARGLEAAVVLGAAQQLSDQDAAILHEFAGSEVTTWLADERGSRVVAG